MLLTLSLLCFLYVATSAIAASLPRCPDTSSATYDYVVVGAGAGGGPVAARLAEYGFSGKYATEYLHRKTVNKTPSVGNRRWTQRIKHQHNHSSIFCSCLRWYVDLNGFSCESWVHEYILTLSCLKIPKWNLTTLCMNTLRNSKFRTTILGQY